MGRKRASEGVKTEPILPSDFERFLRGLVMKEICIERVQAEVLNRSTTGGEEAVDYGEKSVLISATESEAVILASYAVRLVPSGGVQPSAHLQATFRVTYGTEERMTDACFEQLRRLTLRIHTVPFAREWFRDASGRMGIETILLPLSIAHPGAIPHGSRSRTRNKRGS